MIQEEGPVSWTISQWPWDGAAPFPVGGSLSFPLSHPPWMEGFLAPTVLWAPQEKKNPLQGLRGTQTCPPAASEEALTRGTEHPREQWPLGSGKGQGSGTAPTRAGFLGSGLALARTPTIFSHLHPSHLSASRMPGCQKQAEDVMLNEGPGSLRNRCKTTASRT